MLAYISIHTFLGYGIIVKYTIAAKPIKTLELHYTMIQFLINKDNTMWECTLNVG